MCLLEPGTDHIVLDHGDRITTHVKALFISFSWTLWFRIQHRLCFDTTQHPIMSNHSSRIIPPSVPLSVVIFSCVLGIISLVNCNEDIDLNREGRDAASIPFVEDPTSTSDAFVSPQVTILPGQLEISVDGSCGNGFTCLGSRYGDCCSKYGWCGSTADHCDAGCNPGFGRCGAPVASTSNAEPEPTSATPVPAPTQSSIQTLTSTVLSILYSLVTTFETATEWQTSTRLVEQTQVSTSIATVLTIVPQTSEIPVTILVTSTLVLSITSTKQETATVTVPVTSTKQETKVERVTTTKTRTVKEIEKVTSTQTSVSVIYSTIRSTEVQKSTSVIFSTSVITATQTVTFSSNGVCTYVSGPRPSPVQPGVVTNCKNCLLRGLDLYWHRLPKGQRWYKVVDGDYCQKIVDKFGTFTLDQL